MHKHKIFNIVIIVCLMIQLTGCFRNPHGDAENEFRLLMKNEWTASGSDLTYAACGWPVSRKMDLKKLKIDLFPDSSLKEGRGYAEISADGDGFSCGGKLFFIYDYSYTGGHGYSGGTGLTLRGLTRESAVDQSVSDPSSAVRIETGRTVEGELSSGGGRLPDGSPADWYFLEFKEENPAIKFTGIKGDGITITGTVYQDRIPVSQLTVFGTKLKPGRAVILITAGGKTGRYSFRVEDLSSEEKSRLR